VSDRFTKSVSIVRIKAIFWDVGGTLAEATADTLNNLRDDLELCGIAREAITCDAFAGAQAIWEADWPTWQTEMEEQAGNLRRAQNLLRDAQLPQSAIGKVARQLNTYARHYKVTKDIELLLDYLTVQGLRQGVISNWPPSLRHFLNQHKLTRHFEAIVCSGELGISKPSSEIFRHALDALELKPEEALYIGDNLCSDILPARAMGMYAIHFSPWQCNTDAEARDVKFLSKLLNKLMT